MELIKMDKILGLEWKAWVGIAILVIVLAIFAVPRVQTAINKSE